MTATAYYKHVCDTFRRQGNPDVALEQMRYMRHQFEYFGLKMPQWMPLTKAIHKELGIPEGETLKELVRLCFQDDHREMQYFALETTQLSLKKQAPEFIDFLEELIRTRSWWDTVDWLAKLVGIHFKRYPEIIVPVTERWMEADTFWLQRICLIFQLTYKEKTDRELLFRYILRIAHSKEFFLQKGAGWALRHYSRTNPEAVRTFVETHHLAALTRREALRLMDKKPA